MNALKHGLRASTRIICGEDPAHYAALQVGVYEEFGPQNAYQRALADEVVDYLWWCSRCKRVEAGLLTSDLSDQIGVIQPLMQLIKYLHEVSDKQFHEMLALYRYFNNSSGEFEADPPVGNSPRIEKALNLVRPQPESLGARNDGYSKIHREGDNLEQDGDSALEAALEDGDEGQTRKVDPIALSFSRNERFFLTLARYGTSRHNKFVAAVQELRRCSES